MAGGGEALGGYTVAARRGDDVGVVGPVGGGRFVTGIGWAVGNQQFGMVNAELVMALAESGAISSRGDLLRISNRQFPTKFQIQYKISSAETHFTKQYRE